MSYREIQYAGGWRPMSPVWGNPNDIALAMQKAEKVLGYKMALSTDEREAVSRVMWAAERWVEEHR